MSAQHTEIFKHIAPLQRLEDGEQLLDGGRLLEHGLEQLVVVGVVCEDVVAETGAREQEEAAEV